MALGLLSLKSLKLNVVDILVPDCIKVNTFYSIFLILAYFYNEIPQYSLFFVFSHKTFVLLSDHRTIKTCFIFSTYPSVCLVQPSFFDE